MARAKPVAQYTLTDSHRKLLREARAAIGLGQKMLDRKGRVGPSYTWYLESGTTQTTAVPSLIRVLQVLQKEGRRAPAPARLLAGVERWLGQLTTAPTPPRPQAKAPAPARGKQPPRPQAKPPARPQAPRPLQPQAAASS